MRRLAAGATAMMTLTVALRRDTRRGLTLGLALIAIVLVASCSSNKGDPGNRRLKAISEDPGFQLVAPGTQLESESSQEAKTVAYTDAWNGPSASRTLSLYADPAEVLRFYDQRLPELGWTQIATSPFQNCETRTYGKDFGGWEATLSVQMYRDEERRLVVHISAPAVTVDPS